MRMLRVRGTSTERFAHLVQAVRGTERFAHLVQADVRQRERARAREKRGKRGREPASQISLAKESMTITEVIHVVALCLYTTSHPCCSMHRERESVHT